MKKIVSSVLALVIAFSCLSAFAFADDNDNIVYLDNGYYIVYSLQQDVVIQPNSTNQTMVIKGSKTGYLYNTDDELMVMVVLNGTFEYNGVTAKATKATYTKQIFADDWVFESGSAYCNGASVIAEVRFDVPWFPDKVLVVSITCSPTGVLS